MSTLPESEPRPERMAYNFSQLADLGVLWLINRAIFHPRGFAFALDYGRGEQEPRGWSVVAAPVTEPYSFELPDGMESQRYCAVELLLADARVNRVMPPPLVPDEDGFDRPMLIEVHRCDGCGKISTAQRKPSHHLRWDPPGEPTGDHVRCGPFHTYRAVPTR